DVAEHAGALAAGAALEREHLEGGRVRHRDHVRLVYPGKALDRGPVEPDTLGEGGLQLGGRDRDALEGAEHVGEPESDKPDIALLQGTEGEPLLTGHAHRCSSVATRPSSTHHRPRVLGHGYHALYAPP